MNVCEMNVAKMTCQMNVYEMNRTKRACQMNVYEMNLTQRACQMNLTISAKEVPSEIPKNELF